MEYSMENLKWSTTKIMYSSNKTLYQHGEQPLRWTYLSDVFPWTGWLLRGILKEFHRTLFQILFYKPP